MYRSCYAPGIEMCARILRAFSRAWRLRAKTQAQVDEPCGNLRGGKVITRASGRSSPGLVRFRPASKPDRVRDASSASRERPAHAALTRGQRAWWQPAHASPRAPKQAIPALERFGAPCLGHMTLRCRRSAPVSGKRPAALDRRHLRRGGLDAGLIGPAMPGDGARQKGSQQPAGRGEEGADGDQAMKSGAGTQPFRQCGIDRSTETLREGDAEIGE